jgi:hypothetical protein
MDDRIKQILGRARYKEATDVDFNINLRLESKKRTIGNNADKIVSVLNAEDVFQDERNSSTLYRLISRLNIMTDNTLADLQGTYPIETDWDPLFDGQPPVTPNNWLLQVTHPSEIDDNQIVAETKAFMGVRVEGIGMTNPSGSREQVSVICRQNHGCSIGDYIYLYDHTGQSPYHGFHLIEDLGIDGTNLETTLTLSTNFITNYGSMNLKRSVGVSDNDIKFIKPRNIVSAQATDVNGNFSGNTYTTFTTATNNGIRVGNYIDIRAFNGNPFFNGTYYVENVLSNNKFVVKLMFTTTSGGIQPQDLMFRILI